MKLLSLFILLFFSINTHGQSLESILKEYENKLKETQSFHCNLSYKLYQDHTSNVVLEELKGVTAKNKDYYYTMIGPTEFLFSPELTLKVSNNEKVMAIAGASNSHSIIDLDITSNILENFETKTITEQEKYWICDFSGLKNGPASYSRIVMHIAKSSYQITKQILYFSSPIEHGYKNKNQYQKSQRLEISFSDFKKKNEYSMNIFELESYVSLVNSKYQPSTKYDNYKVIDARNNTITN